MNRREFIGAAGAALAVRPSSAVSTATAKAVAQASVAAADDRGYWIDIMRRLADPVLRHLAAGTLRAEMPVEQASGANRAPVTHLESLGRVIAGLAPWIELGGDDSPEGRLRREYAELARQAIARAIDPSSPDALNFTTGGQPLVDAAFLAQGILRSPRELGEAWDAPTRQRLAIALQSTRVITPGFNNWLLFSATVEAALARLGASWDRLRVDYALRQIDEWYKGDGLYGDGPAFHFDYYNSFVIHPMLLDVLDACAAGNAAWTTLQTRELERARRYAAIQERLIAADGSFPPVGRSIAYRFGAFQLLAQMALRRQLPDDLPPPQVRSALTAVIHRSIDAPGTFDDRGWLRIGFCGHQPGIGETYISTGSLYLCTVGLLPLGLAASDTFWTGPAQLWTSARAWSGQAFPIDHAIGG